MSPPNRPRTIMPMPIAVIPGVTHQDGSSLDLLLCERRHELHLMVGADLEKDGLGPEKYRAC